MHPAFPPGSSPLEVDRVEWVPASAHGLRVHLLGRWGDRRIAGSPLLLVGDAGSRHGFAALEDPPPGVLLAFEIPNEMRSDLERGTSLQLGSREVALPRAVAGSVDADEEPGEVIDRAVLAERRARRAELSDDVVAGRTETAERTVTTLTAQLTNIEQRLRLLAGERAELEARLADADRRLRAAEQREHAEQQLRIEAQDDLELVRSAHDAEVADLRERLESATRRAEQLAREIESAGRAAEEAATPDESERERLELLLEQTRDSAQAELKRLEHELAARREVHSTILAELAAAHAELRRLQSDGTGEPQVAVAPPAAAATVLEQRVAALEQRHEGSAPDGGLLREVLDARARELERTQLELRQQLLDVIAGLRAADGDRAARVELERQLLDRERRDAELQRLVAEVLRTSASLRTRFEAEIRELEKRMTDRLVSERAEAAEKLDVAQRKIAALEARAPGSDDAPQARDLTLSLRAEAESLRSELARVRALAEPRGEPGANPATAMIGGLDAAALRLRERTLPLEDDLSGEPTIERAAAPAASESEPRASAAPAPLTPRVVDRERPPASWLAPAIARVALADPDAAERLVLALLPALRPDRLELAFALELEHRGAHRVVVGRESTTVEALGAPAPRGSVEFRLAGPATAFAAFAGGGIRRRPKELRVSGRKRRMRRLVKQLQRPLGMADLHAAGAAIDPGLLLTALAAGVQPEWTVGHRFSVAWKVSGEHAGTWHVDVDPGRAPVLAAGGPAEPAAATVYVTEGALIPLLGNLELPAGEAASVVGDAASVTLLREWFDRAQGLA